MPAFANPFSGNVDKKISTDELIQAVRLDIAGELEAIFLYDAHAQTTDNELAKKVLTDIRDEEKAHVGELMTLLKQLDPNFSGQLASGETEVTEMMSKLGQAQ
jgi:rubrerythrin